MGRRVTRADLVFALIFLSGAWMIFYKCSFGFANIDESFYLTIPYRLSQGDSLFTQEWHLSQMGNFLIYPIFLLYRLFFSGTEGILLHFRYLYTALHALTALFLYLRMRRYGLFAAGASVMYLLFASFGIMALSYNTMGVACTTLSGVLLATNPNRRPAPFFFIGLFYAGAVLCCPYLAAGYVVYAIVCLLQRKWRNLLWITLGCGSLAVVFLAFVLSRASISQILYSLPILLNDPEHPPISLHQSLFNYCVVILFSSRYAVPLAMATAILSCTVLADRKSASRQIVYALAAGVLTGLYTISYLRDGVNLNFLMFCPSILGWFAFLLAPKENLVWFLSTWVLGLLYSLCINWTSNQGFYVISMAFTVGSVGSWIMLSNWLNTCTSAAARRWLRGAFLVGLALFLAAEGYVRFNSLFWEDGGMSQMTHTITVGAEKGIRTTPERKDSYEALYQDTQAVRDFESGPVLYFTANTMLYLSDTKENASFSAWTSGINKASADKLAQYYYLNSQKVPAVIYCMKSDDFSEELVAQLTQSWGYTLKETQLGYILTSSDLGGEPA